MYCFAGESFFLNFLFQKHENVSAFVYLHNPENNLEIMQTIELPKCEARCLITAARKDICTNLKKEVIYDPQLTFWVYLVIRVFIGMIGEYLSGNSRCLQNWHIDSNEIVEPHVRRVCFSRTSLNLCQLPPTTWT